MPRTPTTTENRASLAAAVKTRRLQLGLDSRLDGVLAESTVHKIESGGYTSALNGATLRKVDDALLWALGSAAALLDGTATGTPPVRLIPVEVPTVPPCVEVHTEMFGPFGPEQGVPALKSKVERFEGGVAVDVEDGFLWVYGRDAGRLGGVPSHRVSAVRVVAEHAVVEADA